jgi:hypothetical protein
MLHNEKNTEKNNTNNYLCKYKQLLQIGKDKLNGVIDNDVELHLLNDKDRFNEMLKLNDYVYTYYSTNSSDLTQSIEFIMLSDMTDEFIQKIKNKNYWYIYKKFGDMTPNMNIGNDNDDTIPEVRCISGDELPRFRIKSGSNPNGWKVTKKTDKYINIERLAKIHFLDNEMVDYLWKKYNDNLFDEYFDDDSFTSLYPYLTFITIENPSTDKKNLYSSLVDILRETKVSPQAPSFS